MAEIDLPKKGSPSPSSKKSSKKNNQRGDEDGSDDLIELAEIHKTSPMGAPTSSWDSPAYLLIVENITARLELNQRTQKASSFKCLFRFTDKTMTRVLVTKSAKKTLTPHWKETFNILLTEMDYERCALKFEVWDKHFLASGKLDAIKTSATSQTTTIALVSEDVKHSIGELTITHSILEREQVEALFWQEIFQQFDSNKDGNLTRKELEAMLSVLVRKNDPIESEVFELILQSSPNDNQISCSQFISFVRDPKNDVAMKLFGSTDFLMRVWALSTPELSIKTILSNQDKYKQDIRPQLSPPDIDTSIIHVIVRENRSIIQEFIQPNVRLALKIMYSNSGGRFLFKKSLAKKILKNMTESYGRKYSDPKSVKEIKPFMLIHKLDESEMLQPVSSYKNFNEFFYRHLKPSCRPIVAPNDPNIAVSIADCRLLVFPTVTDATKLWIKGQHFTIANLIQDPELAAQYEHGSLAIFRLAPQDYHRYHVPVDGIIGDTKWISGDYYTVNPIAVRTTIDVFTSNRRSVTKIISNNGFGTILYVCIGATLVGSVNITVQEGQSVKKGDEFGYFAFGGSTIVLLFQPGAIHFDNDLLANSNSVKPIETLVKMGMSLGVHDMRS